MILGCQHKINTPLIYQVQDKSTYKFVNLRKPNNSREPNNYRIHHHINLQTQKTSTHKLTTQTTPDTSTHQLTNSSTHKLKKPPTHQRVSSQTQKLKTHQPRNPSNQKLKIIIFILQYCFNFHPVLAKI